MLAYLSSALSEDEYVAQRVKQSKGTGKLTKSALKNAKLFCKDQFNDRELIIVLADMREEVERSRSIDTPLTFLQKFANWLSVPHLELKMTPNVMYPEGAPCIAKDLDSIKGYLIQIRLYMRKVGGIPITRDDLREYKISYPEPQDKEPPKPLLLEEFKIICDAQFNFRRQMLYRIKKDTQARIGAMCQLRKKHFATTKRPIEIFFPKAIMKKKDGISYDNTKYVIEEDEAPLLKLLEKLDDEDLVFGTNEVLEYAINNEERAWSRLVTSLGYSERYAHNGKLKTSIHSIKAMTFTCAEEAVNETYANAYGDHSRYTKNYLRWNDAKKISKFKLLEPLISIYTKTVNVHDNEELYQENKVLNAKLEEMAEQIKLKTAKIPDEKMQEMFDKYMKEKFPT